MASTVLDTRGLLGVLRKTGLLVGANGVALGAVVLLLGEVVGISRSPDATLISKYLSLCFGRNLLESMSVVSRDNHKSLLEDTKLLQLVNGSANGIIKLQQVTKSTVVIKSMHLLINRSSLRHEEETLVTATVVQDLNSLESHVFKTRQVSGISVSTGRVVLQTLEVVSVDVTVQPHGQVALAEDTEGLLLGVGGEEGGLVQADGVALLGELGVIVLALVGALAGDELLGTSAEVDVGAGLSGPGVVVDAVEGLLDQRAVFATATGVAGQGDGGGVGDEGGRDGAPGSLLDGVSNSSRGIVILLTQTRRKISTMVSTLGSSKGSGEESA